MKHFLVLLGSALILTGCSHQVKQTMPETELTSDTMTTSQEFSTVAAAIASGQGAECEMTSATEDSVLNYQIKGEKMRMMVTNTADITSSGMMISDGNYLYSWSDESKQGMKFTVPTEDELKNLTEQQGQTLPDFSKPDTQEKYQDLGFTIRCTTKEVPDSVFIPPTDVTFTDASAMMQMMKQQ